MTGSVDVDLTYEGMVFDVEVAGPVSDLELTPRGKPGRQGPQGPQGPPAQPGARYGIPASQFDRLTGWYTKLDAAKGPGGRAKIAVLGDSINGINGTRSWPYVLGRLLATQSDTQPHGDLGSRFPKPAISEPGLTSIPAGSRVGKGAAGMALTLTAGTEATLDFYGDGITILYTGKVGAGTLEVYDGPSSGSVVGSVSAVASATEYSHMLDVTLPLGDHTATIKASGGPVTIEVVIPHCGTLTQGFDVRNLGRSGAASAYYLPDSDPHAEADAESHGLDFLGRWQPDMVLLAFGQNDYYAAWARDMPSLVDAIHAAAPAATVLVIAPYRTDRVTDSVTWEQTAETIVSSRSYAVAMSWAALIGRLQDSQIADFEAQAGSIHPSTRAAYLLGIATLSVISGDPLGTMSLGMSMLPLAGLAWTGDVTGNVTGNLKGSYNAPADTIATSTDWTVAHAGTTYAYDGALNITITVPTNVAAQLTFFDLNGLSVITRYIQVGAGTITVASAGAPVTIIGDTATTTPGDVLTLTMSSTIGGGNTVIGHVA